MMPPGEADLLEQSQVPVVAVNDEGTIIFASTPALRLLKRDASLIGTPLVSLVPERLRARHLAGFRRYVETAKSNLQARPVRVPASLPGGREVEVDLAIRVFRRPDGSRLVAAALAEVRLGSEPPDLQRIETDLARRLYQLV